MYRLALCSFSVPESFMGVYSCLDWRTSPEKAGHVSFLGSLDHAQIRAVALQRHSQFRIRTGQPNTRTSCGTCAPLSHASRLDPHAAFPDTRSRSLNKHSVSKNVPDRNPCGLRFHANTRLVGVCAFSGTL